MRVLWFSNVPLPAMTQAAGASIQGYGGHWVATVFSYLSRMEGIALGVVAACPGFNDLHFVENGVHFFVIGQPKRFPAYSNRAQDLNQCVDAIKLFRPELIHIHGSERFYGLVKSEGKTSIPAVLSIQGILGPYSRFNNFFGALSPIGILRCTRLLEVLAGLGIMWDYKRFRQGAQREIKMLESVDAFIGRTEWDHAYVKTVKPDAPYYKVDEIMRPCFYNNRWDLGNCERYTVIFTNAGHPRRGTEILLEAVAALKREFPKINVRLAGTVSNRSGYGRFIRRRIVELGLEDQSDFLGYLNEKELVRELKRAHVFAIASYIENSPNSLAEAMLLGMPCVASYTGGIPSIVDDKNNGLFFPVGDVTLLANCIRMIFKDDALAKHLADNAHVAAKERHDPRKVSDQLLFSYKDILERNCQQAEG